MSAHNETATKTENELGGYLKVSLSNLHFIDTSHFPDD